jgi:hypothetical protein
MSFAESGFAQFMSSPAGRIVRVIAGLAIILWGYTARGTSLGIVLMIIGLVPLIAGAFDLCFFSALFGGPMGGARIRALKPKK